MSEGEENGGTRRRNNVQCLEARPPLNQILGPDVLTSVVCYSSTAQLRYPRITDDDDDGDGNLWTGITSEITACHATFVEAHEIIYREFLSNWSQEYAGTPLVMTECLQSFMAMWQSNFVCKCINNATIAIASDKFLRTLCWRRPEKESQGYYLDPSTFAYMSPVKMPIKIGNIDVEFTGTICSYSYKKTQTKYIKAMLCYSEMRHNGSVVVSAEPDEYVRIQHNGHAVQVPCIYGHCLFIQWPWPQLPIGTPSPRTNIAVESSKKAKNKKRDASGSGSDDEVERERGAYNEALDDPNSSSVYIAAHRGDITAVLSYLSAYPDRLYLVDGWSNSLLHLAAGSGHKELVEEVLALDSRYVMSRPGTVSCANLLNNDALTPLQLALRCGHWNLLDLLLPRTDRSCLNAAIAYTPDQLSLLNDLFSAATGTDTVRMLKTIEAIELHKWSIDSRGKKSQTALHLAAEAGNRAGVEYLLDHGASPFAQDDNGNTPVHVAAEKGHCSIMKSLSNYVFRMGGKKHHPTHMCNYFGNFPLHLAVLAHQTEIVTALAQTSGDLLSAYNRDNQTPLHVAIYVGDREIIDKLLECGGQLDCSRSDIKNPVMTPRSLAAISLLHELSSPGVARYLQSKRFYSVLFDYLSDPIVTRALSSAFHDIKIPRDLINKRIRDSVCAIVTAQTGTSQSFIHTAIDCAIRAIWNAYTPACYASLSDDEAIACLDNRVDIIRRVQAIGVSNSNSKKKARRSSVKPSSSSSSSAPMPGPAPVDVQSGDSAGSLSSDDSSRQSMVIQAMNPVPIVMQSLTLEQEAQFSNPMQVPLTNTVFYAPYGDDPGLTHYSYDDSMYPVDAMDVSQH